MTVCNWSLESTSSLTCAMVDCKSSCSFFFRKDCLTLSFSRSSSILSGPKSFSLVGRLVRSLEQAFERAASFLRSSRHFSSLDWYLRVDFISWEGERGLRWGPTLIFAFFFHLRP